MSFLPRILAGLWTVGPSSQTLGGRVVVCEFWCPAWILLQELRSASGIAGVPDLRLFHKPFSTFAAAEAGKLMVVMAAMTAVAVALGTGRWARGGRQWLCGCDMLSVKLANLPRMSTRAIPNSSKTCALNFGFPTASPSCLA